MSGSVPTHPVRNFRNFQEFLNAPRRDQIAFVETLTPAATKLFVSLYQRSDPELMDLTVWARMLEHAAPGLFLEQEQPSWLRDRVDTAKRSRAELERLLADDDGADGRGLDDLPPGLDAAEDSFVD